MFRLPVADTSTSGKDLFIGDTVSNEAAAEVDGSTFWPLMACNGVPKTTKTQKGNKIKAEPTDMARMISRPVTKRKGQLLNTEAGPR